MYSLNRVSQVEYLEPLSCNGDRECPCLMHAGLSRPVCNSAAVSDHGAGDEEYADRPPMGDPDGLWSSCMRPQIREKERHRAGPFPTSPLQASSTGGPTACVDALGSAVGLTNVSTFNEVLRPLLRSSNGRRRVHSPGLSGCMKILCCQRRSNHHNSRRRHRRTRR